MHVIELFLPLTDREDRSIGATTFDRVRKELVERFGGVTVYARSPVQGEWKPGGARSEKDDLVIFEVMAVELDLSWWKAYRKGLELAFHQDSILCRASRVEVL